MCVGGGGVGLTVAKPEVVQSLHTAALQPSGMAVTQAGAPLELGGSSWRIYESH